VGRELHVLFLERAVWVIARKPYAPVAALGLSPAGGRCAFVVGPGRC
jgi:hypothetical protein